MGKPSHPCAFPPLGLVTSVSSVALPPDSVSMLEFTTAAAQDTFLVAGTAQGGVLAIKRGRGQQGCVSRLDSRCTSPASTFSVDSMPSRSPPLRSSLHCGSGVQSLAAHPAWPHAVTSLHRDSSLVVWSLGRGRAICLIRLPPPYLLQTAVYSSSGHLALLTGECAHKMLLWPWL